MRIIELNVDNMPGAAQPVPIGIRGEKNVTRIDLDFSSWISGQVGALQAMIRRHGEELVYPVALSVSGNVASWLVSDIDTNIDGVGTAEFLYIAENQIQKTAVFWFVVVPDLGGDPGQAPDPLENWLEQLAALGAVTIRSAQNAANSAQDAEDAKQDVLSALSAYRTAAAQDVIDEAQDEATAAKYTKPAGGIPATDMSEAVQQSLEKADTALQQHQSLAAYRTAAAQDVIDEAQDAATAAKYTKPSGGIPATDMSEAVQQSLEKADATYDPTAISGSIVTFDAEAAGLPLINAAVSIRPAQAAGTPTPTSPKAISGWTVCTLSHSGEDSSAPDTVIPLPGTVYFGELDVTSGLLTSLYWITEMGQYTWTTGETGGQRYFQLTKSNIRTAEGNSKTPKLSADMGVICSCFPASAIAVTSGNIRIYSSDYSTAEDFQTAVTGQYLCYELLTPESYQLAPREITTLPGENNIWANCGNVSVTFGAYLPSAFDKLTKNPLKGLKLSLLGDSASAYAGYIPAGNDAYYRGNNAGVYSVDQMWWKRLCAETGMEPLVIDAWSGSAICYNYATDSGHSDTVRIPMCSDLRTGRLGESGVDPDIIIVIGGTNDWIFSQQSTTPLGAWNGRTAVSRSDVLAGQSTFMESYASLIAELHANYPGAVVVCASLIFSCKNESTGMTRINTMGLTESDYNDAIKKVCEIMGVPFISVYNVGFNESNYYPTYSEDSASHPTHPNALGHQVIAQRFINELPRLVGQFVTTEG